MARTGRRAGPGTPGPGCSGPSRAGPRPAGPRAAAPRQAQPLDDEPVEAPDDFIDEEPEPDDDLTTIIRTGARPRWPESRQRGPSAQARTQTLIDRGRRSVGRTRTPRSRKTVLAVAGLAAVIAIASVFIFRSSPSWP